MVTDYITLAILLYFLFTGWSKGVFRSLLGPISLILGCVGAFVYYQQTKNIAISLLICILSPFVIKIVFTVLIKLWHSTSKEPPSLSPISRFFGSVFSVLWGGSYVVMFLILIALVPFRYGWLDKIKDDVDVSKSYTYLDQFLKDRVPAASGDIKKVTTIFEDPDKLKRFETTKEFEALMEDENLQEIFTDEEVVKMIQEKDYGKLMANPKMQALFQNEKVLKKVFALNKKIMEENLDEK